jgi:DNA-binding CsgD family transcriptional regulator
MRVRLTSGRFVGRISELGELDRALGEAEARRPGLVLVGGDSGVGKTRLLHEFERPLDARDVLALRGECVEQADGELPYAPLVGALRPLVRERHAALEALSAGSASQLAALLPGLEQQQSDGRHDSSSQLRLFEALLELLDVLGGSQPVVLMIEDMHWADRSTRTFVSFLARSLRQERLLIVASYRTDELHRRHPLRQLLAELTRLERVRRIELEPFDRDELAEALSDILGERPPEALLERLYARGEGNPLYSEELLAAGVDGRGATPESLRDAFMIRIERLAPDARRAAGAIAVGRALDEGLIEGVTGIAAEPLQAALRDAISEQVLVAGDDGRIGFRHELLREAVYDDLLPGERSELHLALARAIETTQPDGTRRDAQTSARIARHYAMAGDQPAALRATVEAALAARDVHAYGETADLAERALELWPRVPEAGRQLPLDHVELLRLAAGAHSIAGDRGRAEVLLRSALDELDTDADPRRCSAVLARLARIQWSQNRGQEGIATATRALALLPDGEISRERASLLAWLARTQHLRGRYREAMAEGEQALELALQAGDRLSETEVLNTLGITQIALGDVERGTARLRRAIELSEADGDDESRSTAYANLADALNLVGRTVEALSIAREGLNGTPVRMTRAHDWLSLTVSELSLEAGEWEAARATLVPAGRLSGVVLIHGHLREAELALGVGDEQTAAHCLEVVEPLVAGTSEPQWIGTFGVLLAELRRRGRELERAREAVERALDRIELCTDDVARIARVGAAGARVEADIAQRARDFRERGAERDAVARARLHLTRLRAAGQAGGPVERAWLAAGRAELARARGRNDARLWLQAAREWETLERPYLVALARRHAAEALLETDGDRAAAGQAVGAALAIARRLGSVWLTRELEALAARGRLALDEEAGQAQGVSPGPEPAPTDRFGLTQREREVLALLAEGATNRQIGASLFMAEKTASVHVSRILSKLGVRSRTQAAAIAHREQLTI